MMDLTKEENDALEKMRTAFPAKDCCGLALNDATFLRYLRARTFDFSKSSAMLTSTIKWRNEFGICDMQRGWTDIIQKENVTGKLYARGFSKEGHPLLYMRPGLENTRDHDGNMKHLVYHMERLAAINSTSSNVEKKIVLLIDYVGFSLSNSPPLKTSKETLSILQNHYPETLHCAYCISPPWIFNAFWTMISPFIDPLTKAKIKMIRGDVRMSLMENIDPKILETSLGGDDDRTFESKVYLQGDFIRDYAHILNERKSEAESYEKE